MASGSITSDALYPFVIANRSGSQMNPLNAKIYRCKIYESELIHDFVPAKRDEDNIVGLLDLIDVHFYEGDGTGSFGAGPEVAEEGTPILPSEYQQVEYIDEINPGPGEPSEHNRMMIGPSVEFTKIEAKVNVSGSGSSGGIIFSHGEEGYWYNTYQGESNHVFTQDPVPLTENVWTIMTLESQEVQRSFKTAGWADPINYWCPQHIKIEYIKTYNGSVLTCDLVPCYRTEDKEPGMYDILNNEFYTNVGPTPFDYGDDVISKESYPPEDTNRNYNECAQAEIPSYYYQLNYIESNSYQLLNTKVKGSATLELTTKFNRFTGAYQYFGYGLEDGEYYAITPDRKYAGTDIVAGNVDKLIISYGDEEENVTNVNINGADVFSYPMIDVSEKELKISGAGQNTACRQLIYGAKVRQRGVLVRDFVPAMLKDTMQAGLYDLVSQRFFTSETQYDFLRGGSPFDGINKNHINVFCNRGDDTYKIKNTTISSYKVYSGRTIVRDLVSVIRNSDSKPGLYDLVTKQFFVNETEFELQAGKQVLHILDEGRIVKEPTYNEEGEVVYKCSICGHEIHEKTERTSYKVTFLPNSGEITSVQIFESNDPTKYTNSLVGYTRNQNTYNYSKFNASIIFAVPNSSSKEYEIIPTSGTAEKLSGGRYRITGISGDTYVRIIEK